MIAPETLWIDLVPGDEARSCLLAFTLSSDREPRWQRVDYIRQAVARDMLDDAVRKERERMRVWAAKRAAVTRKMWERAARKALAGDLAELRNRIDLIDAGPLDIGLSKLDGEPSP